MAARDPQRWLRYILYPQKLALTSPTSDGCSVGIVYSRTQTTEFVFCMNWELIWKGNLGASRGLILLDLKMEVIQDLSKAH
jgi:hypothetical protein